MKTTKEVKNGETSGPATGSFLMRRFKTTGAVINMILGYHQHRRVTYAVRGENGETLYESTSYEECLVWCKQNLCKECEPR